MLMGTTGPENDREPKPFFPNAKFVCQRKEVDTFRSTHPMQWAWYVPGGMDKVIDDNLVLVDGDVELGVGVAFVATPGHTDGNQSLCLNTPDGVWVSSENGVAADNWHPHLSKIPGVRKWAEFFNREVMLNSNTLEDSIDQYDSMVKEKAVADSNRRDPRWHNVFPSSELAGFRRQWPVLPTFVYGGMNYGEISCDSGQRASRRRRSERRSCWRARRLAEARRRTAAPPPRLGRTRRGRRRPRPGCRRRACAQGPRCCRSCRCSHH